MRNSRVRSGTEANVTETHERYHLHHFLSSPVSLSVPYPFRFSSRSVIPRLRSSSRHSVRPAKRRLRRVRSVERRREEAAGRGRTTDDQGTTLETLPCLPIFSRLGHDPPRRERCEGGTTDTRNRRSRMKFLQSQPFTLHFFRLNLRSFLPPLLPAPLHPFPTVSLHPTHVTVTALPSGSRSCCRFTLGIACQLRSLPIIPSSVPLRRSPSHVVRLIPVLSTSLTLRSFHSPRRGRLRR